MFTVPPAKREREDWCAMVFCVSNRGASEREGSHCDYDSMVVGNGHDP